MESLPPAIRPMTVTVIVGLLGISNHSARNGDDEDVRNDLDQGLNIKLFVALGKQHGIRR
jgi:hypothetical protein